MLQKPNQFINFWRKKQTYREHHKDPSISYVFLWFALAYRKLRELFCSNPKKNRRVHMTLAIWTLIDSSQAHTLTYLAFVSKKHKNWILTLFLIKKVETGYKLVIIGAQHFIPDRHLWIFFRSRYMIQKNYWWKIPRSKRSSHSAQNSFESVVGNSFLPFYTYCDTTAYFIIRSHHIFLTPLSTQIMIFGKLMEFWN